MGKPVTQKEADKYCDGSMDFNVRAIKSSRSNTSKSTQVETDYSIPGKKMKPNGR